MHRDWLFKNEESLLTDVIEFFFASVLSEEHFNQVIATCMQNPEVAKTNRHLFIQKGQFSLRDYVYYWGKRHPEGGIIPSTVIEELLRRFCSVHLLQKSELLLSFGIDYYDVNKQLARFYLDRDALENLAFDWNHLVDKYSRSVLRIEVTDKNGDLWSGTGFVCISKRIVVTNKHVVDEAADGRPKVIQAGQIHSIKSIHRSANIDLALIFLEEELDCRPLYPVREVELLEEIITMGYPRVALAKSSPLVVHKGEINGNIELIHGAHLLFSAKTAPGNSGGPLLNQAGLVVGIATEELQSDSGREANVQPYFAAIPRACT